MLKFSVMFSRRLISAFIMLLMASTAAFGFGELAGSCEQDCARCHQIGLEEATDIVRKVNPEIEVLETRLSPVRGLWEVIIRARGKRGLAYIDFSKKYIVTGSIILASTQENVTNERLYELSKVDFSQVSLTDALVMGRPDARYRVIVFDDPD